MTSFELQTLREPKALPIAFASLHAAALGDQLHVVGLDEHRRARHLGVDARGEISGTDAELPLVEITSVAACGDTIVVAGVAVGDLAVVLGVSPQGRIVWQADIPAAEQYQHWPRPVCAAGSIWVFSMAGGTRHAMRLVQVADGRVREPISLAIADDSDTIDVLGDAEGILIARTHADGQRLELMRVVDDRVTVRVDVAAAERPVAPSLARVGEAIALAWLSAPSEPRLQLFDARLKPLGAAVRLLSAPQPAVTSVGLLTVPEVGLAFAFQATKVVSDARTVHNPDGTVTHHGPRRTSPLWIAMYDSDAQHAGPPRLVDADAKFYAGGWLGDALAIVHCRHDTYVSIFERNIRTGTRG